MKKIILVLFGIFFVIFTGLSLLVCMISGIPTMDQPAATFYLVKAIPLVFLWSRLVSLHIIFICATSLKKETS